MPETQRALSDMSPQALYLSCEHAVNTLPEAFASLRTRLGARLHSHEGFDAGAQTIARHLALTLQCPLTEATVSRLLIDCNRSLHHRHCFSDVSHTLSAAEKQTLIEQYYLPFRETVTTDIAALIRAGKRVVHLSIHSFTPTLNGQPRAVDIGLLYDPAHTREKQLAKTLQQSLAHRLPGVRIRRNTPYRGSSDGLTRTLRARFKEEDYLGIEVEFNQKASTGDQLVWADSLASSMSSIASSTTP